MIYTIDQQSARIIDNFVANLEGKTREIAAAYLRIPNTPDCQPEVLALMASHGKDFRIISDAVEQLRRELDVSYDVLQPELQRRLYLS